jgi:UcrQ family.
MGKHFGELAKIRGIIQYRLSPFEQRAFAGAISKGLPNIFFRIRSNIFRVLPRESHFVMLHLLPTDMLIMNLRKYY